VSQGSLFDPNLYNVAEGETLLSRLTSLSVGALQTGVGFALGVAASPALAPLATDIGQEAWSLHPTRAIDAGTAAAIVAEDVEQRDWGANEAAHHGIDGSRFDAMLGEALNAPGIAELFATWRRGLIDDAAFEHGLRKAKLEPRWDAALRGLKDVLLNPEQLATARQQGFIDQARQQSESQLQGVDPERAELLFDIAGLPPGLTMALEAVNRGLIGEAEFAQIVREGHTKTKYTDLIYQLKRRILSPAEYVDAHLRGWITQQQMYDGVALSGFTNDDADLLFKTHGRPIPVHQITTGQARGGVFNGPTDHIPEAYLRSLQQGSERPEWYSLSYANRYTLPSFFVVRALIQDGTLTAEQGADLFKQEGWPPDLADAAAAAYAGGSTATADKHIAKAETQVWGTLHKSYVDALSTDTEASSDLAAIGVDADAIPQVLKLWQAEREIIRRSLTPAQIRKAVNEAIETQEWALARLAALGYNDADARTFLSE
jgi:hypothetical protein